MDAPLVGRDGELRLIVESLAFARQGQAQVVWLQGDAGAGKTTLLQRAVELASAGPAARCCVWRVTCDLAERLIEHGVSEQLLRRATGAVSADSPSSIRYAEQLLGSLAAQEDVTVVLAIDDLHWCDRSSLQMLRYALRRLDGRVLVLLAHRPVSMRRRPCWPGPGPWG
ncbi:ATP-binding protein [Tessaracoccus massiliensis]|uniref:ATP-binding protein n=1 Tax=Tessaracoccus massiliensis TaxID=1522311 RepID=UPI00058DA8D7|nr:ATP-binding protein [Tessaracoccus massiliensis]